jgi:hypothetical protein
MKFSQTLWSFIGFALLAILGIGGLWLCRDVFGPGLTYLVLFGPAVAAGSLLLIGVLGMIWLLVERLVSSVMARRKAKASKKKVLCHGKSA